MDVTAQCNSKSDFWLTSDENWDLSRPTPSLLFDPLPIPLPMKRKNPHFMKILEYLEARAVEGRCGFCRMTDRELFSLSNVTIRQVKRYLQILEECGYITRFTSGKANRNVHDGNRVSFSKLRLIRVTRPYRLFGFGYCASRTRRIYNKLVAGARNPFAVYHRLHPFLLDKLDKDPHYLSRILDPDWLKDTYPRLVEYEVRRNMWGQTTKMAPCSGDIVARAVVGAIPFKEKANYGKYLLSPRQLNWMLVKPKDEFEDDPPIARKTFDDYLMDEAELKMYSHPEWINIFKDYYETLSRNKVKEARYREVIMGTQYLDFEETPVNQFMTEEQYDILEKNGVSGEDLVAMATGRMAIPVEKLDPDYLVKNAPKPKTDEEILAEVAERERRYRESEADKLYWTTDRVLAEVRKRSSQQTNT